MSTYTPSLGLELITPGSQAGLWGNTTNNSLNLIDQAITGVTPINFASASGSTYTLTDFNGAEDEARSAVINVTGSATGSNTIVVPNKQKTYLVRNNTGQNVVFQTASPGNTYTVEAGYSILIFCDGNNNVYTGIASPSVGTLSVSGGGTGTTSFGAGGFVKSTGGANALTAASKVALGSDVSGTLPVASGGTGQSTLTSGALLVGNGTGAVAVLSGGTVGYVPTWAGSTWVAAAPAAAGVSSLTAGSGIQVNGGAGPATGSVTVSNSGVTSITAGTGITISGATGNVQITASGGGVSSFNGRTGAVSPQSADYSSYYPTLTGSGASGTWNISVSGNAATATSATTAATATSATTAGSVSGLVAIGNGGTGATTAASALTNLGAYPANNPSGYITSTTTIGVAYGGTGATSNTGTGSNVLNTNPTFSNQITSPIYTFDGSGTRWNYSTGAIVGDIVGVARIQIAAGGTYNSTGVYGTISDINAKENIEPARNYLADINKVNVVKYSLKADHETSATKLGVIAQEVEQIFPSLIDEIGGSKNVKLTVFIPMLIKSVQELTVRLEAAEARIAALEAK